MPPLLFVLEEPDGPVCRALAGSDVQRCSPEEFKLSWCSAHATVLVVAAGVDVSLRLAALSEASHLDLRLLIALPPGASDAADELCARGAVGCFEVPARLDELSRQAARFMCWARRRRREYTRAPPAESGAAAEALDLRGRAMSVTPRQAAAVRVPPAGEPAARADDPAVQREVCRVADGAIDASIVAIAFGDERGVIRRVNDAFVQLWGMRDREEAIGRSAIELLEAPEDAARALATVLESGAFDGDLVAATASGGKILHVRASVLRGERPMIVAAFADVTGVRQLESRLLAAQRIARVGHWEFNRRASTLWWSDEVYRVLGYAPGDFAPTYERFLAHVHPDDRARFTEAAARAFNGGDVRYTVTHRVVRADGAVRIVEEHGELLRDRAGRPIGIEGTLQDVTERVASEEASREANGLLRTVIDRGLAFLVVTDASGEIMRAEGEVLTRARCDPRLLVGGSIFDLYLGQQPVLDGLRRTFRGDVVETQTRLGELTFDSVFAPLDGGRGVIGVSFDASRKSQMEAALSRAQKLEAMAFFAAGLAHDFKNILTVISSAARLVLDSGQLVGDARDDVNEIVEASRRADAITRQLIAFGRVQSLEPAAVDVNDVTRALTRIFQRSVGRGVRVELRCAEALPYVMVDRTQLDQVLLNLLVNARDAMPGGGIITVSTGVRSVEARPGLRVGTYVTVAVKDGGVGMDEELLTHIFEPFFTTKGPGEGNGLGLATSHGIIAQTGGAIDVESAVGAGTTFTVLLPARVQRSRFPPADTTGVYRRLEHDGPASRPEAAPHRRTR